ncbi:hypothetical protein ACSBM8_07655 [Sphingomonas sp. ASY06-1R]|jgi:hypothetical protein|uniref:hypothetical protein n=1 Tax=Sphingomonas sp. ASY06-1R TaxID=3445771 RepID=UPI003FA25128
MAMLAYVLAVMIDPASSATAETTVSPHIYLHPPADGCDSRAREDEVIVCGRGDLDERYRLRPADDDRYGQKPVRAETKIGNATIALKADPRKIGDAEDDVYFRKRYSDMRLRLTLPF